jgi:ribonuclease HII
VAVIDQKEIDAKGDWPKQLCDSKLISEKVRNEIVAPVQSWVRASSVGMVSAQEIDDLGIVSALASSAATALAELFSDQKLRQEIVTDGAVIILDGSHNWIGPKASGIEVVVRTKADRDCVSVAAASVIAKVRRDYLMIALDLEVPGYGLAGHKGYASANHIAALQTLGPSAIHRLSWLTKILAAG